MVVFEETLIGLGFEDGLKGEAWVRFDMNLTLGEDVVNVDKFGNCSLTYDNVEKLQVWLELVKNMLKPKKGEAGSMPEKSEPENELTLEEASRAMRAILALRELQFLSPRRADELQQMVKMHSCRESWRAVIHWEDDVDEIIATSQPSYEAAIKATREYFALNEMEVYPFTVSRDS